MIVCMIDTGNRRSYIAQDGFKKKECIVSDKNAAKSFKTVKGARKAIGRADVGGKKVMVLRSKSNNTVAWW